ncbi:uncharacterized protein EI90DRAFT_3126988 [Cantharellus anzutake]|uniref:uncharacterized protein n=1 Tax=Cantharellus anzutake TaxID=1750568 RepID=UPI00190699DB|nr:uncharacterized protein EI90DRAFT_3126988 [Cantharellus anzutake]KAF8327624.1 hypothetical protein EI90DRAFT_3126988 [Cantharellus anzutake]
MSSGGPQYEDRTYEKIWSDIQFDHLAAIGTTNILRILLEYVPGLERHRSAVQHLYAHCFAKHPVQMQKTEYYPMETSSFDEAQNIGNREVLKDLLVRQLSIKPEELDGRMVSISGDCLTVAKLRSLKHHTSWGLSWFTSHKFALILTELWHMKWAFIKGIFRLHWAPTTAKGDSGLHVAAEKLRRKLNLSDPEFYPAERLVETVLATMTLHYARYSLFFIH